MSKRLLIHSAVVFIVFSLYGFVVHGILLEDTYNELPGLWRPQAETEALLYWIFIAHALMAVPFAMIFAKGYENRGLGEGVRFGLLIGIFLGAGNLIFYAIQPSTLNLTAITFLADIGMTVAAGLALAAVYKPE
jgi:hypothetical protein